MGKKDKAHRAKVAKRNQRIKMSENLFQKRFQDELKKEFEKLQEKLIAMSGDTGLLGEDVDVEDTEVDTTVPDEIKDALMNAPEIDFNSIDPSVITYYNDNKSEGETSEDETNGFV